MRGPLCQLTQHTRQRALMLVRVQGLLRLLRLLLRLLLHLIRLLRMLRLLAGLACSRGRAGGKQARWTSHSRALLERAW